MIIILHFMVVKYLQFLNKTFFIVKSVHVYSYEKVVRVIFFFVGNVLNLKKFSISLKQAVFSETCRNKLFSKMI